MPIPPQLPEHDRAQAEQSTDGQVDSTRQNDRCHYQREQPDLRAQPRDLEKIALRCKMRTGFAEDGNFQKQNETQQRLESQKQA